MLIKVSGPLSLENKGHVDIEFSAHDACFWNSLHQVRS
jgi:hypothetical protein